MNALQTKLSRRRFLVGVAATAVVGVVAVTPFASQAQTVSEVDVPQITAMGGRVNVGYTYDDASRKMLTVWGTNLTDRTVTVTLTDKNGKARKLTLDPQSASRVSLDASTLSEDVVIPLAFDREGTKVPETDFAISIEY